MMRDVIQWGSRIAILAFGFLVLALSLQMAHVGQTNIQVNRGSRSDVGELLNGRMPGSLPYVWDRIRDKWVTYGLSKTEQSSYYLQFLNSRVDTAEYVLGQGHDNDAFITLLKAYGYLYEVVSTCQPIESSACSVSKQSVQEAASRLQLVLEKLRKATKDSEIRAKADTLSREIAVLQEQYRIMP